ncbi:MAG: S41 family peptidase [Bacteroidales bacterium]|nr:S41 family peptidase [Bacteroidales bacterium]
MNNKIRILLPLLLAVAFAGGMLLQRQFTTVPRRGIQPTSKIEEILQLIRNNYVEDINIDSISNNLMLPLFEKLDPHSSYITTDNYREMIDPILGSFDGIGVQFVIQNDTIVIVQVIHGGPSEKLDIHAGDRIVSVNDSIIAGNGITNEKTIKLLKGPRGTKVKVGIKRLNVPDLLTFEITRGAIPITSVESAYMITDKIGYIAIDCFSQTTHDEFLSAVSKMKQHGLQKLIVDLRDNGGGLLYTAIDLANEFLSQGDTIVFTKGKKEPAEYFTAEGNGTCRDIDMAVLINEYSASASEIFAGAMQDNGRGTVIGRRSYGKGVVNEDFVLRDSSVVRLSTKKFYTPSGRCIQKPYNGKLSDYDRELVDRYSHGEMYDADSIHFPDSLKFTTKTGKIVYGGGGIMPDIFVALDTTTYSQFFQDITAKSIVYNYAFEFTDQNRDLLSKQENVKAIQAICNKMFSLDKVYKEADNQNIKKGKLSKSESEWEQKLFCCYVIRNVLGDNAFYELYNTDDKTILRAVELLK